MKKLLIYLPSILLLVSCGRDEVETYQVPKEEPAAPAIQQQAPRQTPSISAAPVSTSKGFTAENPDTWTEKPGAGMRMASWSIEGTSIDFYLISLAMGDVPSNVNRWRGQIGLSPAAPDEIATDMETFEAGGHAVNYTELYNEEGGKGIIAAIIDLSPSYWYFTAKGSVEELKVHAGDIRKFLESIKFEGHNH